MAKNLTTRITSTVACLAATTAGACLMVAPPAGAAPVTSVLHCPTADGSGTYSPADIDAVRKRTFAATIEAVRKAGGVVIADAGGSRAFDGRRNVLAERPNPDLSVTVARTGNQIRLPDGTRVIDMIASGDPAYLKVAEYTKKRFGVIGGGKVPRALAYQGLQRATAFPFQYPPTVFTCTDLPRGGILVRTRYANDAYTAPYLYGQDGRLLAGSWGGSSGQPNTVSIMYRQPVGVPSPAPDQILDFKRRWRLYIGQFIGQFRSDVLNLEVKTLTEDLARRGRRVATVRDIQQWFTGPLSDWVETGIPVKLRPYGVLLIAVNEVGNRRYFFRVCIIAGHVRLTQETRRLR